MFLEEGGVLKSAESTQWKIERCPLECETQVLDTSHFVNFRTSTSDPAARLLPPQECLDHSPADVDLLVLFRRQTCQTKEARVNAQHSFSH